MTTQLENNIKYSKQLVEEFEDICYQHGIDLKRPHIHISESKSVYGSWEPVSRTLSISRYLIEEHPWTVVIEVLKHEMAHQYESEILKFRPGHGPSFKQACEKLGVHPGFVKARGNISSDMLDLKKTLAPEAGRMIKKVEKLLSLATSDNEHEAQLASKKANDLIQKYNLDRITSGRQDNNYPVTYSVITHKKKRIESIQKSILAILRDYYFVDTVTCKLFDAKDLDSYQSMILFGTRANLQVAEYVYHYLYCTGKTLWDENKGKFHYTRKDKVSFDMGFTKGIRATLETAQSRIAVTNIKSKAVTLSFKTLAATIREKNQVEITRVFPKLEKYAYGSHTRGAAYNNGYQNGKSTVIKKGIHHKKAGTSALLSWK